MRRRTSSSSCSLNMAGTLRSPLSSSTSTSATLRAGRPELPAKMTSSISPPRMRLAEVSPITQRSASTRFDLPQPLGPTMPVSPGSMTSSVGSTKDLKPVRRSLLKWTKCWLWLSPWLAQDHGHSRMAQRRVEQLLEIIVGDLAGMQLALDEEGGRGIHLVSVAAFLEASQDLVLQRLVVEAGVIGLLVDPFRHADLAQGDD